MDEATKQTVLNWWFDNHEGRLPVNIEEIEEFVDRLEWAAPTPREELIAYLLTEIL
jgi:hypothetical protein